MKFLDHIEISKNVKQVTRSKTVKCAVAFWGKGASDELFLKDSGTSIKIICDVSMGASNPDELKTLLKRKDIQIKYLDDFHAKVYISENGIVIGSANASRRALGIKGPPILMEVGTFHNTLSEEYIQVSSWFDIVWEQARDVDNDVIDRAELLWMRRKIGRNLVAKLDRTTLSSELNSPRLVVSDPDWFKNKGNRHLTELGKLHLRKLLESNSKSGAAREMQIAVSAVREWVRKWGL